MNQQVVYQDISQIHPYENNPRNNEAAVEPVAQSIKRFGFRVPILIDGKGTIIAGHTRYEAAKRLGMDKVPCIRVDDLTDEQIRAYPSQTTRWPRLLRGMMMFSAPKWTR